jgi:hypothetical protein
MGSDKQPAAAADVEQPQVLERLGPVGVAGEARRDVVADIGQPHRIELVQHGELAVRVPPFGGKPGELLHFLGIERWRRLCGGRHRLILVAAAILHIGKAAGKRDARI